MICIMIDARVRCSAFLLPPGLHSAADVDTTSLHDRDPFAKEASHHKRSCPSFVSAKHR